MIRCVYGALTARQRCIYKAESGEWQYDIVYPGFKMNMPDVLAAIRAGPIQEVCQPVAPERNRVVEFYNAAFSVFSGHIATISQNGLCLVEPPVPVADKRY